MSMWLECAVRVVGEERKLTHSGEDGMAVSLPVGREVVVVLTCRSEFSRVQMTAHGSEAEISSSLAFNGSKSAKDRLAAPSASSWQAYHME